MPNSESMHAYSKACLFLKITAMFFVNGKGFSVSAAACSPVLRFFLRFTLCKEGKREADCTRNYGCSQQTLQSQTVVYENIGQSADNKARSRKITCTSAFCKITFFSVQLVKICAACSGSKTKGRTFNNSFNNKKKK